MSKLKNLDNLVWNVFYESINDNSIVSINILKKSGYVVYCIKERYKHNDLTRENLIKDIQYMYWGRVEYELILKSMTGRIEQRVDIYEQIISNKDAFFFYLEKMLEIKIPTKEGIK